MLSKIIAIAWTHFYIVYTDRGALILMLLIPVALSTIIGLAFGQVFSSNPEIETARILVINQDEGAATAAGQQNLGDIYVKALYVFQGAAIKTANRADKTALPRKRAL